MNCLEGVMNRASSPEKNDLISKILDIHEYCPIQIKMIPQYSTGSDHKIWFVFYQKANPKDWKERERKGFNILVLFFQSRFLKGTSCSKVQVIFLSCIRKHKSLLRKMFYFTDRCWKNSHEAKMISLYTVLTLRCRCLMF